MLYLKHDFYSNFSSGIDSGDNDVITDIIVNELSELIVYKTDLIFKLLERVGLKTSKNVSDERLVDIILDNLSKNNKLIKGLAFLIAESNEAGSIRKVVKGKDGKERVIKREKRPANIKEIDMIASGIIGLSDSFVYKPQLKKEFKIKLMDLIVIKSKAVGDRTRKHGESNNGKYWLLALLVVGAGVATYFYLNSKNKKKIAAEGALLEGAEVLPVEPPVIQPAPVVSEPVTMVETPPINTEATAIVEPVNVPTI